MIPLSLPPVVTVEMAMASRHQIGDATMEQDGSIRLRVRMEQDGMIGDWEKRYTPGAPGYEYVRAHLPNLKPGQNVPIYNDWP